MRRVVPILLSGLAAACSAPEVRVTDFPVDLRRPGLEARLEREAAEREAAEREAAAEAQAAAAPPAEPAAPAPAETEEENLNLGSSGSNSAARLGVPQYERGGASQAGGSDRDCDDFETAADAQRFFLTQGGPARDPNDLDRDGDGFACDWGME